MLTNAANKKYEIITNEQQIINFINTYLVILSYQFIHIYYLIFPPSLGDLIRERLRQVADHDAWTSLNEAFDRHAGLERHVPELTTGFPIEADTGCVKARVGLRIDCDVGRDARDPAGDLRCGLLIEGRELHHHRLAGTDVIAIVRLDAHVEREAVLVRHDQHGRLIRGDQSADGVDGSW